MLDDQVLNDPDDEDEEDEETDGTSAGEVETLQSELERLIEVMLPPVTEQEIEGFESQSQALLRTEMMAKFESAIARAKTHKA